MTLSQASTQPIPTQPTQEYSRPDCDPACGLMIAVADLLIPLFTTTATDPAFARQVARSALDEYQPKTGADYVNAARTLAFSLTALALLGQAVAPDLPMPMKLRLFGRANALNRSADQSERTMMQRHRQNAAATPENPPETARQATQPGPLAEPDEAAVLAAAAEAVAFYTATFAAALAQGKKEAAAPAVANPAPPVPATLNAAPPNPIESNPIESSPIDLGPPPVPVSAIHYAGPAPGPIPSPRTPTARHELLHSAAIVRAMATIPNITGEDPQLPPVR